MLTLEDVEGLAGMDMGGKKRTWGCAVKGK